MTKLWGPPSSSPTPAEPRSLVRHSYIAALVVGAGIGGFLGQRIYVTTLQIDVLGLARALDPKILWVLGAIMAGLVLGQLVAFVLWLVFVRFVLRRSRHDTEAVLSPSWQECKLDCVDRALLNLLYGKRGV